MVVACPAGRRVMEIGCGPGLVATCLCRSGPDNLLLTDGDPQTLINCLSNLSLNGHFNATLLGSWQDAQGFVEPQTPLAKSQRGKQPQVQETMCVVVIVVTHCGVM